MTETPDQRVQFLQRIRAEQDENRKIKRRESRIKVAILVLAAIYVAIMVGSAVTFAMFHTGV